MKILQIDVNYKYSSTGKIVHDLHQGYQDAGFDSYVYYGRGEKKVERGVIKFGLDFETYFHAFMTRLTGLIGFFSPISTLRLIRGIKKIQPDVIHIHELHAYFVNYGLLLKFIKKQGIKTLWTFHCEHMYTGKCAYTYQCDKYKTQCRKCPQKKEYPKSWFFDFSNFMFKHKKKLFEDFNDLFIVTPSSWLAERVKSSFLKSYPIQVINNGIDNQIFKPSTHNDLINLHRIEDELIVLSVAPNLMDTRKGGRRILKIASKTKELNIKYFLIGVNNPPKIDLDNVIFIPRTKDQNDLAKYYSLADVFLILSDNENYPTTCLESLSCGTPLLGYDSGGTAETGSRGFSKFVNFNNSNAIIKELKTIPKKDKKISQHIFSKYHKYHSAERMTHEYVKLIRSIKN